MSEFDSRILDGIRVMAALVDTRSFVRASEALGMTQSGVSRAIARLEERIGTRLFDRTTRSVRLNEDGRRYYAQVMPLLAHLDEITAASAGGTGSLKGRLRVNVDPYFARVRLLPRLGEFLAAHADLEVELVARDQLGDMVSEGFDLAIRFGHPRDSSLVARKLLETRILTTASPAYLKRRGHPREPRELEGGRHLCIQFRDPETGRPFPWEFHQRRKRMVVHAQGALTVNEAGMLHSACAAGLGIAQVIELGAEQLLATGKLVQLFPDWADETFPLHAYYPSRHHVPAKIRAMVDFVVRAAAGP